MLDIKLKFNSGHTDRREWMTPSPLKQLFWNVTYACNARCEICFARSNDRMPNELSTSEAKQLIHHAADCGIKDIIISGGEPFMRSDLIELLTYMGECGITARIASNGLLLNDDILKALREKTKVLSFQISLDTLDPERYGRIHGLPASSFDTAISAIHKIYEHGFHTTISTRVTKESLQEIPDLLDLAHTNDWKTLTLHLPLHTSRAENAEAQDADLIEDLGPIFDHFHNMESQWLAETYVPWIEYHPLIRNYSEKINFVHRGCRAGRDRLTVNPDGELMTCVCFDVPDSHVGNVRKNSLLDVFNNAPLCKMMKAPKEHGICSDCGNVEHCGGGCRTAAYAMTGSLTGQDKACPVWKAKQR